MNKPILSLLFAAVSTTAALAQPTVTTDTRFARGATKAYGRLTVVANGSVISRRGFCFSDTNKQPTIDDSRSGGTLSNNGVIYKMEGLKPATKYYARAYATTQSGETYYGDVIKFYTLPKGTIGWGYDNGGSEEQNKRINTAVEKAVDYWNNLTSINGLYLNVHYGAQTPTADCSYGGWMRVGPNASYQAVGTIMHEALHAIGVGTDDCGVWKGTVMRSGNGTGQWLGDRATDLVRFWNNDNTAIVNGDGTHVWPYGINGAQEDNGSELLYTATSLLAQALGEDGLPATTGMRPATPYYSFDIEDDERYYLKVESDKYGLFSSFLVEDDENHLILQSMTAEEAAANDAAAWEITFTPDNQYYQMRNAKTGNYISLIRGGVIGIGTVSRQTPEATENFQLMRSRIDVTCSDGAVIEGKRGYWIASSYNKVANPATLAAVTSSLAYTGSYNMDNSATEQRWLILTADEALKMETSLHSASMDVFKASKQIAENILATGHIDLEDGATAELQSTLALCTEKAEASHSADEIKKCSDDVIAAVKVFLTKVIVSDVEKPFNLSFLITNPGFDGKDGWALAEGATCNYSCLEFYQTLASASQSISGLSKGTYTMKVQGFQRPGARDAVYTDYAAGKDNSKVAIWINSTINGKSTIANIMSDRQAKQVDGGAKQVADKTWVPDNMASAHACFDLGLYENSVTSYITSDKLDLIIRGANGDSGNWTCFDNVRLMYYGPMKMAEIEEKIAGTTAVAAAAVGAASNTSGVFTPQGIRVADSTDNLAPGLYIYNGKTITIK